MLLRADCTYDRMLSKCVEEIYPHEDKNKVNFYIADSRGAEVWNGDQISVDVEQGGDKIETLSVDTTLNYLELNTLQKLNSFV